VAATAPAVAHFGSAFIATPSSGYGEAAAGDHLQSVYRFWLVGHQLEHGAAPWRDAYQFQPLVEPELVLAGWPWGLPFWPLDALFGPVVAWNVLLLAGIAAAGLATYAWLNALGAGSLAAAIGGLAYAIAPYRVMQSGGHLLGWLAVLIPVALWAYERARAAETRRSEHLWSLGAALCLLSIPLSGQVHLAMGALPLAVVYAAVRYRRGPFFWILGAALVGAGGAIAIQQTLIEDSVLAGSGRTLEQIELFQATWRGFVDRFGLTGAEPDVYIGWLTPLVALAGLVLLARRRRWLALLAAVALFVPLLLAVGTHVPTYEPLWRWFPPMRFPRVPERLLPIADLALAALVAVTASWALARIADQRRRAAVALVALALVAGDLLVFPLRANSADPGNAAYAALAASPAGRTIELPVFEPGIHFGSIYDYYALQTPRERPSGYSTLAPDPPYDFFWSHNRLNCGIWLPGDIGTLRILDIRYLLFHVGAFEQSLRPNAWLAWKALQDLGLRATTRGGDVWLFPLEPEPEQPRQPAPVAEPPRDQPILCEGWKGSRMKQRDAGIWVWGAGPVELELSAPAAAAASIQVDGGDLEAFAVPRRKTVRLRLRGERWHLLYLRIPQLFDTPTPQGLTLERITRG
jgi:hypothetical protein